MFGRNVFGAEGLYDDDLRIPRASEEHILAMIARITSPIPGPSSHKQRRKSLRSVARGVMFIQRVKYVFIWPPPVMYSLLGSGKQTGK